MLSSAIFCFLFRLFLFFVPFVFICCSDWFYFLFRLFLFVVLIGFIFCSVCFYFFIYCFFLIFRFRSACIFSVVVAVFYCCCCCLLLLLFLLFIVVVVVIFVVVIVDFRPKTDSNPLPIDELVEVRVQKDLNIKR